LALDCVAISASAWKLLFKHSMKSVEGRRHLRHGASPSAFVSLIAVFFSAVAPRATAAIDFTPTTGERKLEGVIFKQLIFHEEGRQIAYEQPTGWNYSGDARGIRFTPPDFTQAQAEIQQSPLPEPQKFDEPTIKLLQEQVLASIPKDSQHPAILAEEKNSIRINGSESYEVTVGYALYVQEYQLSVIFVNLPKTQLRFRVVARKQDFDKVHRLFRASLFSLQWK
jgi:hypothetical protein